MSCYLVGGWPTTEVFAKYYELHYHRKKIKKDDNDETLSAQFRCITFSSELVQTQNEVDAYRKDGPPGGWVAGFIAEFPSTRAKVATTGSMSYTLRWATWTIWLSFRTTLWKMMWIVYHHEMVQYGIGYLHPPIITIGGRSVVIWFLVWWAASRTRSRFITSKHSLCFFCFCPSL
jgi:hypothetical protein